MKDESRWKCIPAAARMNDIPTQLTQHCDSLYGCAQKEAANDQILSPLI